MKTLRLIQNALGVWHVPLPSPLGAPPLCLCLFANATLSVNIHGEPYHYVPERNMMESKTKSSSSWSLYSCTYENEKKISPHNECRKLRWGDVIGDDFGPL